jgi:hypothetical protein
VSRWDAGSAAFGAEAVSRSLDILSEREQAVVRAATVLVAGCDSVGDAVVELLARMGVTRLRLADARCSPAGSSRSARPPRCARTPAVSAWTTSTRRSTAHVAFDPAMSTWVKYQLQSGTAPVDVDHVMTGVTTGMFASG